ncbi:hypothetical protein M758_12G129500 [Ceratodon purpureus]|nr:hypothetical protein M758_12G129500 [Ceratodon purpureus]
MPFIIANYYYNYQSEDVLFFRNTTYKHLANIEVANDNSEVVGTSKIPWGGNLLQEELIVGRLQHMCLMCDDDAAEDGEDGLISVSDDTATVEVKVKGNHLTCGYWTL